MENEIIIVRQLPVIEEQLFQIKSQIENKVATALAMDCTEDTYKQVKTVRAELNKDFASLEEKRKSVKEEILAPYKQFESIYKSCVTDVFAPALRQLTEKSAAVENGLKAQKQSQAEEYFKEYLADKCIDFLTFEQTGVNITLSASLKSIKEKIKAFIDKISDDLAMIDTQEHKAEILVEYKRALNVSNAIMTVNSRHKAIEEERMRQEKQKADAEAKAAAEEKINAILDEEEPEEPEFIAPTVQEIPQEEPQPITEPVQEPVKKYRVSFTIVDTLENIKALKAFMAERGMHYE